MPSQYKVAAVRVPRRRPIVRIFPAVRAGPQCPARIRAAVFSAIIKVGELVLPEVM
jgi:hypothetical protein